MAASVITTNAGAYSASGPTVSIPSGWTPLVGHHLVVWVSASNTATANVIASGFDDVGPGLITPGDTTIYLQALIHAITSGEETAGTTSWDLSGLFTTAETGEWIACAVQGADATTPIDAFGTFIQAGTGTAHQLAGLAGADVADDSLVLSGIIADAPTITYTSPGGWTPHTTGAGTNTARWSGVRDTLTTAGVDVAATNITPSVGDEALSITVALTAAAAGGPSEGASSGAISWAGTATGARVSSGAASGGVTLAGAASGATVHAGSGSSAIGWAASATGSAPRGGAGSGSISWGAAATGATTRHGAASGSVAWAGSGTGSAPGVDGSQGSGLGGLAWSGTATGARPSAGLGSGGIAWAAAGTGATVRRGSAAGSIAWVGASTGAGDVVPIVGDTYYAPAPVRTFAATPPVRNFAPRAATRQFAPTPPVREFRRLR